MAEYQSFSGKVYQIESTPFAAGGEGGIYKIIGDPENLAKIYKPEKRTTERERKLSFMILHQPSVPDQFAWPQDMLYENGKIAGYIMKNIRGKKNLRSIYVYDNRKDKPWSLYVAIAKNLAAAIYNVHEMHQVVGDLNPDNVLVNPQSGLVTLVDTDSYHISEAGRTYRCENTVAEYVAPELQGVHYPSAPLPTFTAESDRFSLAVLIFALLMNGSHPYACSTISGSASKFQPIENIVNGKSPFFPNTGLPSNVSIPQYAPELDSLPTDLQNLFYRAFIAGTRDPSQRPDEEEWYRALGQLEGNLKICPAQHIYYNGAKECPWCKVEKKMSSPGIRQNTFAGSAQYGSNSAPSGQARQFTPGNYQSTSSNYQSTSSNYQSTSSNYQNASKNYQNTSSNHPYTPSNYQYNPGNNQSSQSGGGFQNQNPPKKHGLLIAVCAALLFGTLAMRSCSSANYKTRVEKWRAEQSANTGTVAGTSGVKTVSETNYRTLSLDGIFEGDSVTVQEEPAVSYSGKISDADTGDIYTYTAPRDGRYGFHLEGVDDGASIRVQVLDGSDKELMDNRSSGNYAVLDAGETYKIQVSQYSGSSAYRLVIGVQKKTTDISAATTVHDQVSYSDQKNVYLFTPPRTGRYRFDLTDVNDDINFQMMMWDQTENCILDRTIRGCCMELNGGETYELQVRQNSGFGSYTMQVYFQKPTQDITGYDKVRDSVQYDDQKNRYTFTPQQSGEYTFTVEGDDSSCSFELMAWDPYDNNILDTRSGEGKVSLEADRTYEIQVRQYSGRTPYSLWIQS